MNPKQVLAVRLPLWRRAPLLAAVAAFGIVLSACGVTDSAGTNFKIVLEGDNPEESLAGIGYLQVGESAKITFVVTPKGGVEADRTTSATFVLAERQEDDDASTFNLILSSDLVAQPYHYVNSYVYDAKVTLCATYSGPEVAGPGPQEVCVRLMTEPEPEEPTT